MEASKDGSVEKDGNNNRDSGTEQTLPICRFSNFSIVMELGKKMMGASAAEMQGSLQVTQTR